MRSLGVPAAILVLATLNAQAAPNKPMQGSPLLPGGNSKEPISIEADKLVYFDKEQKAIYSGNVVAIQGDTRLTCSIMTVHMTKTAAAGAPAAGAPAVKVANAGPAASANRAASATWTAPVPSLSYPRPRPRRATAPSMTSPRTRFGYSATSR